MIAVLIDNGNYFLHHDLFAATAYSGWQISRNIPVTPHFGLAVLWNVKHILLHLEIAITLV